MVGFFIVPVRFAHANFQSNLRSKVISVTSNREEGLKEFVTLVTVTKIHVHVFRFKHTGATFLRYFKTIRLICFLEFFINVAKTFFFFLRR